MNKSNTHVLKAVRCLKSALSEMNLRNIPATPGNYAVWYEYAAGINKELMAYIKRLDEQCTNYATEVNQDIYRKFISPRYDEQHVEEIKASIMQFVGNLLNTLSNQDADLSEFSQSLRFFSQKVETVKNTNDLEALFIGLMVDTKRQEESTLSLQESLRQMAADINAMRNKMERASEEASVDELTQIGNRRMFERELQLAIDNSLQSGDPLALILLDIDLFKNFNDKYGHLIGDKVLRFVATVLTQSIKRRDKAARIGGEEFALILPDTNYEGALAVASQICQKVGSHELSSSKDNINIGSITISAGVSTLRTDESKDDFFYRADKCLYLSKEKGRNRVTGEGQI